ncbi:hypothetical protein THAOC_30265, partial [Thalassiosira oceanica]
TGRISLSGLCQYPSSLARLCVIAIVSVVSNIQTQGRHSREDELDARPGLEALQGNPRSLDLLYPIVRARWVLVLRQADGRGFSCDGVKGVELFRSASRYELSPLYPTAIVSGARGPSIYIGREPDAATSIPDGAADVKFNIPAGPVSIQKEEASGGERSVPNPILNFMPPELHHRDQWVILRLDQWSDGLLRCSRPFRFPPLGRSPVLCSLALASYRSQILKVCAPSSRGTQLMYVKLW